jgi:ABC-type bacteriocin/lantibiotic exporter with double-glycine peptidase domain
MINLLPRYFIEATCFSGILFLILFLINSGVAFINIIPAITLNLLIAYRLIPGLQQIYNSFSQIRFSIPALNYICGEIRTLKIKPIKNIKNSIILKDSISLKKIYFNYTGNIKTGLKNINITIPVFSKIGIIGASGSGKSTFVNIVLGLLNPSRGNLVIDGNIVDSNNKSSWQSIVGYVPQQIYLSDSSIASNIAFGQDANKIDYKAVEDAAKLANIHEFVLKKLPNRYLTNIGERGAKLSGGQIQRIGIARALYNKPQVLILDEATSGLDNLTEKFIFNSIDKLKKKITIIIVTHRLSALKNSDYIFWFKNGTLKMKGSYKKILKYYEILNKNL